MMPGMSGCAVISPMMMQKMLRQMQHLESKIEAMDAKLDARFKAMDDKIDAKIEALDAKLDARFKAMDDKIEAKIESLDEKWHTKFGRFEAKIEQHQHWCEHWSMPDAKMMHKKSVRS